MIQNDVREQYVKPRNLGGVITLLGKRISQETVGITNPTEVAEKKNR